MIQLYPPTLSERTADRLEQYQQKVLNAGSYTVQVAKAKKLFKQNNTQSNNAFKEVRRRLSDMCIGPRRCNYCEDSVADEVEHIAPKDFYPERAFLWENYCYACGPCNGPKNNQYAVFRADQNDAFYEIPEHPTSDDDDTYCCILEKPPLGQEVLIDPRRENPLDFLLLDIAGGFQFIEYPDPGTKDFDRAEYTIRILSLNTRADLIKARYNAYCNFRARLYEYIHKREKGALDSELNILRENLRDESHQTVWKEMQRQYQQIPELEDLFDQIPQALTW